MRNDYEIERNITSFKFAPINSTHIVAINHFTGAILIRTPFWKYSRIEDFDPALIGKSTRDQEYQNHMNKINQRYICFSYLWLRHKELVRRFIKQEYAAKMTIGSLIGIINGMCIFNIDDRACVYRVLSINSWPHNQSHYCENEILCGINQNNKRSTCYKCQEINKYYIRVKIYYYWLICQMTTISDIAAQIMIVAASLSNLINANY